MAFHFVDWRKLILNAVTPRSDLEEMMLGLYRWGGDRGKNFKMRTAAMRACKQNDWS